MAESGACCGCVVSKSAINVCELLAAVIPDHATYRNYVIQSEGMGWPQKSPGSRLIRTWASLVVYRSEVLVVRFLSCELVWMIWSLDVIVYQYTYIIKQLAAMHFWRHQLTVSLPLCSWTCSSSLCVITVSTVRLQTVQFVQYLYSICAVLLCSWSCSRSLCVITVSTVQLQTVQFVQYLYSKCAVQ